MKMRENTLYRIMAVVIAGALAAAGYLLLVSRAATPVNADLNNSGKVDVFDLSIMLSKWNQTGSGINADLNADNIVNVFDLSILLSKWGTSSGGFQANCINKPSDCGYPDATNTGVPAGTTLTNSGDITVSQNGAVVDGKNIVNGTITVLANNVTIKNTRITTCDYYPIRYFDNNNTGLVIQDTEIAGTCADVTACMSFDNYTTIRVNCHGGADGFKADANATIQDSYIHDLAVSDGSHNDGVQTTGGDNVTLRHNTFDVRDAGVCVQFGNANSGWLVTQNLFNCGGWMLNGGSSVSNNTFTNNRFTRHPGYGPVGIDSPNNIWTGNYFDDNGAVVDY
jgi:hypothetical protein